MSSSLLCPLCSSPSPSWTSLETHLRTELRYSAFLCGVCPAAFVCRADAEAHFAGPFPAHPAQTPSYLESRHPGKDRRLRQLLEAAKSGPGDVCGECACCRRWRKGGQPTDGAKGGLDFDGHGSQDMDKSGWPTSPPPKQPRESFSQSLAPAEEASEEEKGPGPQSLWQVKAEAGEEAAESKPVFFADGKVGCLLCGLRVAKMAFTTHATGAHMKARPFLCNLCPYREKSNAAVVKHLKREHPGEAVAESVTRLDLSKDVARTVEQCFGSVREAPVATKRCRECDVEVRSELRRRHVATAHLKKAIFACRLCPFTSSQVSVGWLNTHLRQRHKQPRATPENSTNQLDKYLPLINRMVPDLFQ